MHAKHEMNEGRRKLEAILAKRPPDSAQWSEAQNRFQFIDSLLMECLGWQKPEIRVEEPDGASGRIDYLLGSPAKAVLEAKREAVDFGDLPASSASKVRKLAPLLEASRPLADAVTQAIQYCALKGAKLGVVCNGRQLLIFQALCPDHSPLEGECYFFNGYTTYLESFSLLWRLLSPEGVAENRAYREISLHRSPRIPPKASESIPDPNRYRYRSDFQENIRTLASFLLDDLEDDRSIRKDFYTNCYVSVDANNRHLLLSKQMIAARYQRATTDATAPSPLTTTTTDSGSLSFEDPNLARGFSTRPIVVLGDVGVGKTSFFENLYFDAHISMKSDTYFIHINLGLRASLAADVRRFVLDEIPRVLRDSYSVDIDDFEFCRSIYNKEMAAFDRSPTGTLREIDPQLYQRERVEFLNQKIADRSAHLLAALAHLCHGRKKQIILILDNADQRNFETQQATFLIAQELSWSGSCLIFVALRPSTFFESKKRGALSGYQNKVFAISPPPADEVIKKRLSFALRIAEGKQIFPGLEGIRLRLDGIILFLRATLRSIRSNEDIRIFLSNITGGNTRAVIELISSFFGSPNVDSEKIINIERDTNRYKVPLHEFTKHALLGEYSYYNPQSSLYACNVYDVSIADSREHFLKPIIISYLASNPAIQNRDGFVMGESVISEMLKLGFIEDQTRHALRKLARSRLIETPHSHFREIEVHDEVSADVFDYRVTSIGCLSCPVLDRVIFIFRCGLHRHADI